MANLTETATFDAGVYKIETTDQVIGGETGISNKAAKNLANRTNYLKNRINAGTTKLTAVVTRVTHDLNIPVVNQSVQLTLKYPSEADVTHKSPGVFGVSTVNYFEIYCDPLSVGLDADWLIYDTR